MTALYQSVSLALQNSVINICFKTFKIKTQKPCSLPINCICASHNIPAIHSNYVHVEQCWLHTVQADCSPCNMAARLLTGMEVTLSLKW